MYCPNCGKKLPDDAVFCDECGEKVEGVMPHSALLSEIPAQETPANVREDAPAKEIPLTTPPCPSGGVPAAPVEENAPQGTIHPMAAEAVLLNENNDAVKKMLASTLMLIMAILATVSAAVGMISGGFSLTSIFLALTLWLVWGGAKSQKPLKAVGFGFARAAVMIQYVVNWIGVGLMAFLTLFSGGLIAIGFAAITPDLVNETFIDINEFIWQINSALAEKGVNFSIPYDMFPDSVTGAELAMFLNILFITLTVFCVIMLAVIIVVNIVFVGKFKKYVTNNFLAVKEGRPVALYDNGVAVRTLIIGICCGVSALSSLSTLASVQPSLAFTAVAGTISLLCTCAVCVIAFIFIRQAKNK